MKQENAGLPLPYWGYRSPRLHICRVTYPKPPRSTTPPPTGMDAADRAVHAAANDADPMCAEPHQRKGKSEGKSGGNSSGEANVPRPNSGKSMLRHYYDEFAGKHSRKGYDGGNVQCDHGYVVMALEALVGTPETSHKCKEIDLATSIADDEFHLYEVKTSVRPKYIYEGIGQLVFHGARLEETYGRVVKRFLVLPEMTSKSHPGHVPGITVVTFQKDERGYRFTGFPKDE